jgi:hypothetical protein
MMPQLRQNKRRDFHWINTLVVDQKTRKQKSALRVTQLGSWEIKNCE